MAPYAVLIYGIAVAIAAIYGWVMNIVTLFTSSDAMATPEIVIRAVGVPVTIVGAFLGYL